MPQPFTLDQSPLDAEITEIATRELNETPERVAEAVPELRRLLHDNTDLFYPDDDQFLISVLRPCHFYPESAIKLVSIPRHYRSLLLFVGVQGESIDFRLVFLC